MVEISQTDMDTDSQDEPVLSRRYFIDSDSAQASRRSLSVLVASRQCYMCQQAYDGDRVVGADPQDFMDQISAHCSTEADFLLPDTPLKEAIFRVLLAHGNEPMDAEEIGRTLSEKWAMTPFPRNTTAPVIQRLLNHSDYYCVVAVPPPDAPDG